MADARTNTLVFLQEVFDSLTSHICVVDHNGDILQTNEAWKRFAQQNSGGSATSNGNYLAICNESAANGCEVARQFSEGLQAVLANHAPCFLLEYDCHSPDEERWFICRITRFELEGQVYGVISHQNITPKMLAEQSLEQSEAVFRATFDQAVAGMVQCDLEGRFTMVNRAFCRITGYREDELLKASFMDITLPEDLEEDLASVRKLLSGQQQSGYTIEKRYVRKDGRIIWVNLHVSLVRRRDSTPRCLVGVVEDITDRKQAEARAQELNLQLEQRLNLLTQPEADCGNLEFNDLFDLEEIEQLQELLTKSLGISSIITTPDGSPLTRPVNFCRLCSSIIRATEVGLHRCKNSNRKMGVDRSGESFVATCHSAGLLDGGTSIFAGSRKIANWVVGQVLDEAIDPATILPYAEVIGADREQFAEALALVPRMSRERFETVCRFVAQIAHQLSTQASRNYQQARAIEERIKAETALEEQQQHLQQSSRKLQTVIDTIGDGITLSDSSGHYSIYNRQMEQITGYSMAEANSCDSFMHLLYPDPLAQREVLNELALLIKLGENRNVETSITTKGGGRRTLSISSVVLELEGKKQFLTAWHDITSRKHLTDALIASERQLSIITRNAGEAIIMMNGKGQVSYWNPAAEAIFGYTMEEVVGHDLHQLLAPQRYHESLRNGIAYWQRSSEGPAIGRSIELFGLRKDGSEFPLELTLSSVSLNDGLTAIGIVRDITERRRVAEELQRAKESAEAASQAKSNFLANMSHELRTPLNSIIGFSELIHDGITGPVSQLQQDYLGNVLTSSRHLLQIISEILDLSRIEAGRLKLEPAPCSLNELLQQVQSIFSEQFTRREVALQYVTKHPDGLILVVDEVKLRQVVINLLSNALKFTDTGGEVRVVTSVVEADQLQQLIIEVSDTGIGIREEDLPKLFQEFSQIEPAMTRNREGTGLGLALSKRLIELHGGSITVTSRFGVGSSFTVSLPIREPNTP